MRLIIIDSCFSGRAIESLGSGGDVADATAVHGVYTLTATEPNVSAHVPRDQTNVPTSFTGEFVGLLREGIPSGSPWLTLGKCFLIGARLRSKGLPKPQQRSFDLAAHHRFAKNKGLIPIQELPQTQPAAVDSSRRRTPRQVLRWLDAIRLPRALAVALPLSALLAVYLTYSSPLEVFANQSQRFRYPDTLRYVALTLAIWLGTTASVALTRVAPLAPRIALADRNWMGGEGTRTMTLRLTVLDPGEAGFKLLQFIVAARVLGLIAPLGAVRWIANLQQAHPIAVWPAAGMFVGRCFTVGSYLQCQKREAHLVSGSGSRSRRVGRSEGCQSRRLVGSSQSLAYRPCCLRCCLHRSHRAGASFRCGVQGPHLRPKLSRSLLRSSWLCTIGRQTGRKV